MKYILKKINEKPFLCSKNNIVTEVNNEFLILTGYFKNELIGKSLSEISIMLRLDSQIDLGNIKNDYIGYIFTKECEPIETIIDCKRLECKNEKSYFFKENPNLKVNEKFNFAKQLYTDDKTGVVVLSIPDLILLKANENYLNFLDEPYKKIENSLGKKQKEIITGFEGSNVEEIWNSVINEGKTYHFEEVQYDYFKRGITYWNSSTVPIFTEGKLKYVIHTVLDVTEKVLNTKLLTERVKVIEEQKEQLEGIIENMSDKLIIFDKDGYIIKINQSGRNFILNYDKFKKLDDFYKTYEMFDIDGNLIVKSKEELLFSRIRNGENISKYQVVIKFNNKPYYIELNSNPIYDREGNFSKGIILIQDITDRLKSEETLLLETQHNLLSRIIENMDIGFVRYSYPNFKIIDINNKAYSELKQIQPKLGPLASVKGKTYFDVFEDGEKNDRIKSGVNLIEKKTSVNYINRRVNFGGEEKFFKIILNPLFGLNNQICEMITISIDITDEVKAKNEMEKTLKIQDEIFSNISHELKTPLNVIFSTNQLMELYLKKDLLEDNHDKIIKGINTIKQNCYRFIKLINNVIDISKIESGFYNLNLSNVNIVDITEEIVQSLVDYVKVKGLNIIFDTNTEEKIIACDPDKFERIILNLISNAIKFTDVGGSIFVNIQDTGDNVEISVKDTGIGMDKKHLDNIFKRFHQVDKSLSRNAEGSGIGLSLVNSLVKLHGGKISVESKPDEGSIFIIKLPANRVENPIVTPQRKSMNSKIEMINIEFSDIYSIY